MNLNHVKKVSSVAVVGLSFALLGASVTAFAAPPTKPISLNPIGTYRDGAFDVSAAEIVAHDPKTQRLFVVNADPAGPAIDVLDISDPTSPSLAPPSAVTRTASTWTVGSSRSRSRSR